MAYPKQPDAKDMFTSRRDNYRLLHNCKRHFFGSIGEAKPYNYLTCQKCGGSMQVSYIIRYIDGYKAAGGKASDIITNWEL